MNTEHMVSKVKHSYASISVFIKSCEKGLITKEYIVTHNTNLNFVLE